MKATWTKKYAFPGCSAQKPEALPPAFAKPESGAALTLFGVVVLETPRLRLAELPLEPERGEERTVQE